ncbi:MULTISPECIES: hypothetical protein [unclassified Novosphingobium]|uniref:hypothetical protein n=1 Tax=unclassified Novosphingobium TaxID=2644732 RepID=UPI00135AD222|nr:MULTISPECIES: hypothetical protein [unclassified Novosphingobium]
MSDRACLRAWLRASSLCLAPMMAASPALADTVQGNGRAAITKDTESVRNLAILEAKRDIVRAMLITTIGAGRIREATPDIIDRMAGQVRDDMISDQTSERMGKEFVVHLTADIDQAWFRTMLSDFGLDSASQRADGNRQMILVYLDRDDGTATDLSAPAEIDVEYDRRTGASFSDTSSVTASAKEAGGSSYRNASGSSSAASGAQRTAVSGAYRERGVGAGGYAGSSASGYSNRASSASATKASSAYAASSSFADKTNVQAEVHDDVYYRAHVVYQTPPKSVDGDAIRQGLNGALLDYDVQVADSWMALSSYYPSGVPRYQDLKRDPSFAGFLGSLKAKDTPFFMGGSFKVTQSGRDPASGQALCSGQLDAGAAASEDGRTIASGVFPATALGISPEDCAANLAVKLSNAAAAKLGPQIQRRWRTKATAALGQDTRQEANYTLVLRAAKLDMGLQQDLMDAIASTPGAQMQAFVSSGASEVRLTVSYAGAMPLQFALFQQLRSRPAFAAMQSTVDGRAITLCLSACGGM